MTEKVVQLVNGHSSRSYYANKFHKFKDRGKIDDTYTDRQADRYRRFWQWEMCCVRRSRDVERSQAVTYYSTKTFLPALNPYYKKQMDYIYPHDDIYYSIWNGYIQMPDTKGNHLLTASFPRHT